MTTETTEAVEHAHPRGPELVPALPAAEPPEPPEVWQTPRDVVLAELILAWTAGPVAAEGVPPIPPRDREADR